MDKLVKHLRKVLLQNPAIQIKKSNIWHLPIHTYEVQFKRVRRSKMDILMKMMLLTLEEADIRRPANLSELLLVEELFIADLLKKMLRIGLIRLEKEIYKLTSIGRSQLETGIFAEEMEEESTILSYSPFHLEFWPEMSETIPENSEDHPLFRYANNKELENAEQILQFLAEKENGEEEDGFQIVVEEVTSFSLQNVEYIPCFEFQLYNQEQDTYYARVWNLWLNRWDETLEQQIEEKERINWRNRGSQ